MFQIIENLLKQGFIKEEEYKLLRGKEPQLVSVFLIESIRVLNMFQA